MDEALVAAIHDPASADLEPRVRLAMLFVERWVRDDARSIDDAFFAELREHFSERELLELAITTGTVELSHKFNTAFGVIPRPRGRHLRGGHARRPAVHARPPRLPRHRVAPRGGAGGVAPAAAPPPARAPIIAPTSNPETPHA